MANVLCLISQRYVGLRPTVQISKLIGKGNSSLVHISRPSYPQSQIMSPSENFLKDALTNIAFKVKVCE